MIQITNENGKLYYNYTIPCIINANHGLPQNNEAPNSVQSSGLNGNFAANLNPQTSNNNNNNNNNKQYRSIFSQFASPSSGSTMDLSSSFGAFGNHNTLDNSLMNLLNSLNSSQAGSEATLFGDGTSSRLSNHTSDHNFGGGFDHNSISSTLLGRPFTLRQSIESCPLFFRLKS